MEKFTYQKILLDRINPQPLYSVRFDAGSVPEDLQASIARHGVLMPILVTADEKPVILAGYRRYAALSQLRETELSVLQLTEVIPPRDAFLMAVVSNWKSEWSECDRAFCIGRAVTEWGFTAQEGMDLLLPAMGLESRKHIFEDYLDTSRLERSLLEAIHLQNLPYRGARQLGRFKKQDQIDFAESIAVRAALTSQDLQKVLEWLNGLMRQTGKGVRETLFETGGETILTHPVWDRRAKGEKLCRLLRQLAHPSLTQQEQQFAEVLKSVPDFSDEFRIEAPPFFEEQGYQLRAKLKSPADLIRYRKLLDQHSEWLNSLFDFML